MMGAQTLKTLASLPGFGSFFRVAGTLCCPRLFYGVGGAVLKVFCLVPATEMRKRGDMRTAAVAFVVVSVLGLNGSRMFAQSLTILASTDYAVIGNPNGDLIADANGNLYGTASWGAANGLGTIFEYSPASKTVTPLVTFNGTNGANPYGGLLADGAGNMYGTTFGGGTTPTGGPSNLGTVFEVSAATHALTTLVSFNGSNGATPHGGLVPDASGNLYGTTQIGGIGGINGGGTVFQLSAASHTLTTLASFSGGNGQNPTAGVIVDASGNIYGTTLVGGALDHGTLFEIPAATHTLTTLVTFGGTNGANPDSELINGASGSLYGTTNDTVFRYDPATATLTTLYRFSGADGTGPNGPLVMNAAGNLYGTTFAGGAYDDGTLFELDTATGTLTTLVTFDGSNGYLPAGGLLAVGNGNFYGATAGGGEYGSGTIFEFSLPEPSFRSLFLVGLAYVAVRRRRRRLN